MNIYLDFANSSKEGKEFPTKKIQTKQKDEIRELDPTSKNNNSKIIYTCTLGSLNRVYRKL